MNRNRTIWVGAAMVLLAAAAACSADEVFPVVHNEPIAVRVLEGKSGAPQARVHVVLVAGYSRRDLALGMWREEAVTDGAGTVGLSDALRNLPLLRVEVLKRGSCASDAGEAAISVERIRRDGLSEANRCGTAVAVDMPGVLAVYVKGKTGAAKTGQSPAAQPAMKAPGKAALKNTAPVPALTDSEIDEVLSEQN
ncbi:MAG: hypothetical protein ABR987_17220 [Terracidiphilus sp.]